MSGVDDAVSDRPYRLPSERDRASTELTMDDKHNTHQMRTYSELGRDPCEACNVLHSTS